MSITLALNRSVATTLTTDGVTLVRRLYTWIIERLCGLRGHSLLLGFEPHRMFLRCGSCGYETHGWQLDPPHYRQVDVIRSTAHVTSILRSPHFTRVRRRSPQPVRLLPRRPAEKVAQ